MPGGCKRTRGSHGAGRCKRSRQQKNEVAQIGGPSPDSESVVGAPRGRDQSKAQQGPSNLPRHIIDFQTFLRDSGTLQGQNITNQTSSIPPSNTNPHITSQNAGIHLRGSGVMTSLHMFHSQSHRKSGQPNT